MGTIFDSHMDMSHCEEKRNENLRVMWNQAALCGIYITLCIKLPTCAITWF